jgi:hypothetical protein
MIWHGADPFVPDEMAQHRTMRHCPMCLQLPCACAAVADRVEPRSIAPEHSPAAPELSEVVEELCQSILPERWEERADLE